MTNQQKPPVCHRMIGAVDHVSEGLDGSRFRSLKVHVARNGIRCIGSECSLWVASGTFVPAKPFPKMVSDNLGRCADNQRAEQRMDPAKGGPE